MSWRSVSVFVLGISIFTTTHALSWPVGGGHLHHWAGPSSYPAQRDYVRPNNDKYYTGWSRSPRGWVYFGPQYTFVPGRGIIDEACNLPSSSCPNTQRDGQ
jgi:hypothetical protein